MTRSRNAIAWVLLGVALLVLAWSPRPHREAWYQKHWAEAHGGQIEVRLADGARVDILTATEAIEVDFAPKWAEAVGQALYYGSQTERRPAVLLIQLRAGDAVYAERIRRTIQYYGLPLGLHLVDGRGQDVPPGDAAAP